MREWFISNLQESLVTSVHDVQMILNYLASRGDLDVTSVGMFGDGSGASIAILASATDSRIKAIDLLEPWGDWPVWLAKSPLIPDQERAEYVKPAFLDGIGPLEPSELLPKLGSRAVLLQMISTDDKTPKPAKERIEAAMPPNGEIIHYENTKPLVEMVSSGKFFDWLKEQVRSGTGQPTRSATVR
jgi:acetyl esterase/lipase